MKHFLFLLFIVTGIQLFGQVTVTILPKDQIVCFGGNVKLTVIVFPDTTPVYFQWRRNNIPLPVADSSKTELNLKNLTYADTGYYTVTAVMDTVMHNSDTAFIHLRLKLTIDTLYRYNNLGCPGTCKGQMKTHISGGNPPYVYEWGGGEGSQDTIVTSLCKGNYVMSVYDSDSSHCISREYKVEVLTLPKISFTKSDKIIYLTKPNLTVSFPDTSVQHLTNWEWTFFEGTTDSTVVANINPATHTYRKSGSFSIRLQFTDINGCDSTIYDSITVKVAELQIPDVITPYPGSPNQTFVIKVKEDKTKTINDVYVGNELVILNRWGKTVYSKTNYRVTKVPGNEEKDIAEWDGGNLAEGVYFFIFTGHGLYGDEVYKGSFTIIGRDYKTP